MKVYNYDNDGFYIGSSNANPNPKSPGDFLLPARATFIKPPSTQDGFVVRFNGSSWDVITDYSAQIYYNKETKAEKKYYPGEDPDLDNYTDIEPVGDVDKFVDGQWILSPETIHAREVTAARQYLAETDWYVTRLVEPGRGEPIPDEVKAGRFAALDILGGVLLNVKEEK